MKMSINISSGDFNDSKYEITSNEDKDNKCSYVNKTNKSINAKTYELLEYKSKISKIERMVEDLEYKSKDSKIKHILENFGYEIWKIKVLIICLFFCFLVSLGINLTFLFKYLSKKNNIEAQTGKIISFSRIEKRD